MIHIVLGTKAQLVKMAPVMSRLKERGVPYNFIFTGQHRATTREMLVEFELKEPDVVLYDGEDVVSIVQVIGWATRVLGRSIVRRRQIFQGDREGIVLVHGDTFSTVLGGLMGRMSGLRVGHVESGLRSFNVFHPFPEELNRLATFRLSHVLFCPGSWAVDNVRRLRRECVDTRANTLSDTLHMALRLSRRSDHVPEGPFGLVSLHRYENIFKREMLGLIVGHLQRIAGKRRLLFILHPPTQRQIRLFNFERLLQENDRIELRPRYTYFDFVSLLEKAEFVITDGGSIQEESSYLGLPCLLMRKTTERQEGIGGNAVLSHYDARIVDDFVDDPERYRRPPAFEQVSPSDIIVDSIKKYA
jgi:UDP-N-acetylglucosamine 2-epimerase (non-hydrolysing)